ncbi:MAG: tape measure protein [Alphaproteobacteria bacterium]
MAAAAETRVVRIVVDGAPARDGANVVRRSLGDMDSAAARNEASIGRVRTALGDLRGAMARMDDGNAVAALRRITTELDAMRTSLGASAAAHEKMAGSLSALAGVVRMLAPLLSGLFAGVSAGALVTSIIEAGDAVTRLEGRFRALTGSGMAAKEAVQQTFAIASRTGAAFDEVGQSLSRFTIASQAVGATRAEAARLVETVMKLGTIGGSTTQELAAGALQLGQALSSGRLQGDELRSILENMPLVAKAIADQLGVSVGKLKEMGSAGELTAEKVFGALLAQGKKTDEMFAAMPLTVSRAAGEAKVAWMQFAAAIDESLGLSQRLAASLQAIAGLLRNLTPATTAASIASLTEKRAEIEAGLRTRELDALRAELAEMRRNPEAYTAEIASREKLLKSREAAVDAINRELEALREQQRLQQQATAWNQTAEQAAAAQAKANLAAAEAAKKHGEGMAFLNDHLKDQGALQKRNETISKATQLFNADVITQQQFIDVLKEAEKTYVADIKKTEERIKKKKEEKTTWAELNESVREATAVALEHERRLAAGSKEYLAIAKADDDLADSLTKRFIPASQKASAEIATYDRLLQSGRITQDTYAAAVAETNEQLERSDPAFKAAEKAAERYEDVMAEPFKEAARSMQNTFADTFEKIFSGGIKSFGDFGDSVLTIIKRMAAQIAALLVFPPPPGATFGVVAGIDPSDLEAEEAA